MKDDTCPDELQLAQFARGQGSDADIEQLGAHLDTCSSCRRAVVEAASDDAPPSRPSTVEPPARIGAYDIEGVLGRGAMGLVLSAWDSTLARKVALKVLLDTSADPALNARLEREARAMAQLNHPNVVTLYEFGQWSGRRYLAMEYVDGLTLDRWLAAAPRTAAKVLEAVLQAGRGLAAAHNAGLVHRDIKPHNVLIGTDGRVRVTDFGLSRVDGAPPASSTGNVLATQFGTIVGTPAWMAPEQLAGGKADAASDQFALCVVLVEALTGSRPWAGQSVDELRAAMTQPPRLEGIPRPLRPALQRGLSLDPSQRFPNLSALLDVLERAPAKARQERRTMTGSLLAVLILCAGGYAWKLKNESIDVHTGAIETVVMPCLTRVAIGDPTVADVKLVGSDNVIVLGTGAGTTTLITWGCDGARRTWTVHVTGAERKPSPEVQDAGDDHPAN